MSGHELTRWRAAGRGRLSWRVWDGELVVFNPRTGSTHLLSEFAGEVLLGLIGSEEGITVDALAARLAELPAGADRTETTAAIAAALSDFARLELAETVSR